MIIPTTETLKKNDPLNQFVSELARNPEVFYENLNLTKEAGTEVTLEEYLDILLSTLGSFPKATAVVFLLLLLTDPLTVEAGTPVDFINSRITFDGDLDGDLHFTLIGKSTFEIILDLTDLTATFNKEGGTIKDYLTVVLTVKNPITELMFDELVEINI